MRILNPDILSAVIFSVSEGVVTILTLARSPEEVLTGLHVFVEMVKQLSIGLVVDVPETLNLRVGGMIQGALRLNERNAGCLRTHALVSGFIRLDTGELVVSAEVLVEELELLLLVGGGGRHASISCR